MKRECNALEREGQKELIHNSNWDILIVLDACRYDYFKRIVGRYLEGELKKVISSGSHTIPWLKNTFGKRYYEDIVYISANPFINSKIEIEGFYAKRHFYKVIDVWNWGWDNRLGTVPPSRVNMAVKMALIKYRNTKRIIVHYLQPHAPYLLHPLESRGDNIWSDVLDKAISVKKYIGRVMSWIEKTAIKKHIAIPNRILRMIYIFRLFLGIRLGPEREFFAKYGLKALREAYQKNLEVVLKSVSSLLQWKGFREKNIVITADHGELLGDGGFSHPPDVIHPILIEVPWFKVHTRKHLR